jgi:hypothetical protein
MATKTKKPRPGVIALAGLPTMQAAARDLSRVQFDRLAGALDAICRAGSNVPVVVLERCIALAAQTPREEPPPVLETTDRVCDWCGTIFSGRAWGNRYGVFCSQEDAEAAREHAEAKED